MTDWTRHVHPEIPVIWIEDYYPQMDVLLAVPVWEQSSAAAEAIARGLVRKLSREEAQKRNESSAQSLLDKTFLAETLAERWARIKEVASRPMEAAK